MTKTKKNRIFYLDQLRAIAIILVVLSHVSKQFARNFAIGSGKWIVAASFADIAVMGVPLFLMISGALLLNRNYELPDFMKRRYSRILIPFIFWGLLLPLLKMFLFHKPFTIANYIHLFFFDQYWFVFMLIVVYLMVPILNSFVKDYDLEGVLYLVIIWFIFIILLNDLKLTLDFKHTLGWAFIAGYIGYLPLGYYLANKKFNIKDEYLIIIGLLMFIIFTFINIRYTVKASIRADVLVYYGYRRLISTLQTIGVFIFFKAFADYCENHKGTIKNKIYSIFKDTFLCKIIVSVSICSYGIYLTHYFFLYPLVCISVKVMPIFTLNPLYIPVVLIGICFMAWILVLALSKIPILKHISGAH